MIEIKISDHPMFPSYRRKAILIGMVYEAVNGHYLKASFKVITYSPDFIEEKPLIEGRMDFVADSAPLLHPEIKDEQGNITQESISDIDLLIHLSNKREPLLTTLENVVWAMDRTGKLNDRLGLGVIPSEPNLT